MLHLPKVLHGINEHHLTSQFLQQPSGGSQTKLCENDLKTGSDSLQQAGGKIMPQSSQSRSPDAFILSVTQNRVAIVPLLEVLQLPASLLTLARGTLTYDSFHCYNQAFDSDVRE
ncbi:unnamed protein product [Schistocephalus solidus]|uniref:Tyrosine-protein phosphatase domain-containing protein n=1 Tax=Schistocephalus solidus TaxID=70667 RepID=A0A183TJA1_SCHSO|nr:unnamed protein product [Schistocephalus solidus]